MAMYKLTRNAAKPAAKTKQLVSAVYQPAARWYDFLCVCVL